MNNQGSEQRASQQQREQDLAAVLAPWVVSVCVHVGIVLVAVFIVWRTVGDPIEPKQPIVFANPHYTPEPQLTHQTDRRESDRSTSTGNRGGKSLAPTTTATTLIGGGAAGGTHGDASGGLAGLQPGRGVGDAPFPPTANERRDLTVEFLGVRGTNARRIVFLLDASGSTIDLLPMIVGELEDTIGRLSDKQNFTVIFFQDGDALEIPTGAPGFKQATQANKLSAIRWLNVAAGRPTPGGQSDPMSALDLSLQYRPDTVFIVSDNITGHGRYEVDQLTLLRQITAANASAAKINTIQLLYRDPLERAGLVGTLELISQRTGGLHKFVDGRELGIQ